MSHKMYVIISIASSHLFFFFFYISHFSFVVWIAVASRLLYIPFREWSAHWCSTWRIMVPFNLACSLFNVHHTLLVLAHSQIMGKNIYMLSLFWIIMLYRICSYLSIHGRWKNIAMRKKNPGNRLLSSVSTDEMIQRAIWITLNNSWT